MKTHVCNHEECGKTFNSLTRLRTHYNYTHVKAQCPECEKKFSVNFLNKHITNTHHISQKKYWCEKCGKGFVEKWKFEQHEEVEHKGHRFKCRFPGCKSDQEYRDQSNRLAHERKKHGATYSKFLASST